jgi:predicted acetyltransferase
VSRLVAPTPEVRASYLAAVAEFLAEGQERFAGTFTLPPLGEHPGESWEEAMLADPDGFAAYCMRLAELGDPAVELPEGYVHNTILWWVDGTDYFGRLSIRHRLTASLLTWGGHIGYAVRPTARRCGYGTAMVREGLRVAREVGIESALITCDVDNEPSRRIIEAVGGVYEDTREGKLRYWVPTLRN